MSMDLDEKLVCAAREGDREAFSRLIVQYQEMVYALCYRITGRRHDAEDLAHDTFVQAYVKLGTLREASRFASWLRSLALNLARMWYRRQRQEEPLGEMDVPAGQGEDGDEAECARLLQSVGRLPAVYRFPVVLHYLEGMPCEGVAAFLGVAPGTVLSRLHRARQFLKDEMKRTSQADEEVPVTDSARFHAEIDAEISVLLEAFDGQREQAERLSAVLGHSPERLAKLVAEPKSATTLANIARLLPRLGTAAIGMVLERCFHGTGQEQRNAREVLKLFVREFGGVPAGADLRVYALLAAMGQVAAEDGAKVELVADLLEETEHLASGMLMGEWAMSMGRAAYRVFFARLARTERVDEVYRKTNFVFQSLRNTGMELLRDAVERLEKGDAGEQERWLAVVDALAVGVCGYMRRDGQASVPGPRFVAETSDPAIVRIVQLEPALLERAGAIAAGLLADQRATVRRTAVRVLERLEQRQYAPAMVKCLADGDMGVRMAAIYSLAAMGAHEALLELAVDERAPEPVRRAAEQAMSRSRPEERDGTVHRYRATPRYPGKALEVPHAVRARFISVDAALRALPELRPYSQREITERIAAVCTDWASSRRGLVEMGLMECDGETYTFTESGAAAWRVERAIMAGWIRLRSDSKLPV